MPYFISRDMIISDAEVKKLLKICGEKAISDAGAGRKNWLTRSMLVQLVVGSGLMVSEISRLKIGDLHLTDKEPYIVVWNRQRGTKRDVHVDRVLSAQLSEYVEHKEKTLLEAITPDAFLLRGEWVHIIAITPLKPVGTRLSMQPGLACPISHARHTYAAKILTESGDLRYVQHQLGFATIAFAALYADVRPACNNENSYSEPHIVGNMMSA